MQRLHLLLPLPETRKGETMPLTMAGYYVADERFPPGTRVTIDDFAPGDWHVCFDWPEDVPEVYRTSVHIAGCDSAGVHGDAWLHPGRLHRLEG